MLLLKKPDPPQYGTQQKDENKRNNLDQYTLHASSFGPLVAQPALFCKPVSAIEACVPVLQHGFAFDCNGLIPAGRCTTYPEFQNSIR